MSRFFWILPPLHLGPTRAIAPLSRNKEMDVLLDNFDTGSFDFSTMVEISEPLTKEQQEQQQEVKKKRDKLAARACVLCNQAHTACDNGIVNLLIIYTPRNKL